MSISKLSCIIVDDEPLAVSLLQNYCEKLNRFSLIECFSNPYTAIAFLEKQPVDIVFLDIQMPELSGIQFMKLFPNKCLFVLTTAYPEFALNAFELDAIDYLVKPITYEKFEKSVNKTEKYIKALQEPGDKPEYVMVKTGNTIVKILLGDILYLEGRRDYVAIHTLANTVLTLQNLKDFEEYLPENNFLRIHKSYLVSTKKITSFTSTSVFINDTRLPIGITYKSGLKMKIALL